jgi:hypothetical protein
MLAFFSTCSLAGTSACWLGRTMDGNQSWTAQVFLPVYQAPPLQTDQTSDYPKIFSAIVFHQSRREFIILS